MDAVTLIGSGLVLSMDNFAVAAVVSASLRRPTAWQTLRLTLNFGVFQSIMTALGCLGGTGLSSFVGGIGCWISFGLLTLLGINMLRDSPDEEQADGYPTKGWRIIGLSIACAVDALTAGVALSLMGTDTWELAPVFGATAAGMAFIGTRIGMHAGLRLGQWPQRLGGFVLIGIGIRGVTEHLIWSLENPVSYGTVFRPFSKIFMGMNDSMPNRLCISHPTKATVRQIPINRYVYV